MNFKYALNTEIEFGSNKLQELGAICKARGYSHGILVCDPIFISIGLAQKALDYAQGCLCAVFSDITPNPTITSVDACAAMIEKEKADFLVALGGGSSLDCAKAASVAAFTGKSIRCFHSEDEKVTRSGLPLIAVPTTAGTGSEVTNVAVLSDPEKGLKMPMASDFMYAKLAIVDPVLTLTLPPQVVASTGLDALSHALEGFWSKNHQPICDAAAIYSAKLVFDNICTAYLHGDDLSAKENMSIASLIAGLAFGPPKTAASHACSFPLTNIYHIPHGEACAFTLDALVRINCKTDGDRINMLAKMIGFSDAEEMACSIAHLKKQMKMKCTLSDAGIRIEDIPGLAEKCKHPNLLNNPTEMTQERLVEMFLKMQ